MRIAIAGGSAAGLFAALLLARVGHDVVVLERDRLEPAADVESAAAVAFRPSAPQIVQPHLITARCRQLLIERLPDVYAGMLAAGVAEAPLRTQPSLYSHFASKQAIYDAMFKQAWQAFLDSATNAVKALPAEPRPRLIAIAENYFDFAVADLPRHQLMDVNVVPNFQPSPEAYAPAMQVYHLMLDELRGMGITRDEDADVYTALIGGLVNQQLANDPGGQRWRRLIPRLMSMFADDLGLP